MLLLANNGMFFNQYMIITYEYELINFQENGHFPLFTVLVIIEYSQVFKKRAKIWGAEVGVFYLIKFAERKPEHTSICKEPLLFFLINRKLSGKYL